MDIFKYFELPHCPIKMRLLLFRDGNTSEKLEMRVPAPSPSPLSWLPLCFDLNGQLSGEMLPSDENTAGTRDGPLQAWDMKSDVAGMASDCCFLKQRCWRSPQNEAETLSGLRLSSQFSSKFYNLFSLYSPHAIITYLLYIDCQIWGLCG